MEHEEPFKENAENKSSKFVTTAKRLILTFVAGVFIGIIGFVTYRFITFDDNSVHRHANFALYVNGVRESFADSTYFEEVAACGGDAVENPKTRVHMHDQINHLVHVHDSAATWGHFFANLGLTLGDDVLVTDDGAYMDGTNNNELNFILNGEKVESLANKTIKSEDTLLIDYGNSNDSTLEARFNEIPRDAGAYNQKQDPSSCSGGQKLGAFDKLKNILGISAKQVEAASHDHSAHSH